MLQSAQKYFNENRGGYSTALLLLLANIIFYFAIVAPNSTRIEQSKLEYFNLRKSHAKIENELLETKARIINIGAMETDIKQFLGELPTPSAMTGLGRAIHKLAKKNRLEMRSVKYSLPQKKKEDILVYAVSLPVTGSYKQVRRFIYHLEKMPYLMTIDNLNLSASKGNKVSLNLNISFYFKAAKG